MDTSGFWQVEQREAMDSEWTLRVPGPLPHSIASGIVKSCEVGSARDGLSLVFRAVKMEVAGGAK